MTPPFQRAVDWYFAPNRLPSITATSPRTAVSAQPHAESTTPRDPLPRPDSSPARPSFASPTRASLERFNPEIVRKGESQPRAVRSSPDAPPAASRAATPDSTGSLTRAMRTKLELRSAGKDGPKAGSEGGSVLRSPARQSGAGWTPTRPTPRPLPPPAPEEDDELLRAFSGRLRPAASLGVLPEVVVPEPELPPTPEHPDPVVSTPPSGIHNTPSRRRKRSRTLAERPKSSSPLKQSPLRPPGKLQKDIQLDFSRPANGSQTLLPSGSREPPTNAELRGLKFPDPDAEKKKLRDSLMAEVSQLERDLTVASRENERIRQARLSRRAASPPSNKHDILDLLSRRALPPNEKPTKPYPVEPWLASALNPITFLPFSKHSPSGALSLLQPPSHPDTDFAPPVSHHPLPMTAAEALPYLQVFTPLTFTSHVSPLPPSTTTNEGEEDLSKPILQHHTITASSTSPRGLFTARLEMTVNTKTMAIAELSVPRLDPAAEAELRPFVERVVTKTNGQAGEKAVPPSSGLHNNVGVLTWAMGEWVRVAVKRAKMWSVLEREVCAGKESLREMVARQRRAGRRKKGRKRRRKLWVAGEEGREEEERHSDSEEEDGVEKYGTADLLPFMGRTSMDLEVPALDGGDGQVSTLRVQWRIGFDWTGEARSEVGVLVGVPGKWHKHDERGKLSGLPKLFDELIEGSEEPLTAVRTIVCLLAGEARS
ncbi:hypothetical protein N657DRAFT_630869 [Parathielavia appendiculata]|uniref:Uncharacterized protein n=1 Tax=Parathielavia appendiculata TaxID=2587402 RepID=A0AAN6U5Q3_9PEZI|nr:hypothetical protein N657DRAFT_630869 [Parathielavia appendiculata]